MTHEHSPRPDIIVILTDQERAAPPYESDELRAWRSTALPGRRWFAQHGVSFHRHYTGSLACVPSRPTLFTGQYPDVHGATQTDGLGKDADDSRMRWLRVGEVPTLGHWFRAAGYDTHYQGKWHLSHADLLDGTTGRPLPTNDDAGVVDDDVVARYQRADVLDEFGFSGWIGPEPHGGALANSGLRRDPLTAARVVAWLEARYAARRRGDRGAASPFLLVASFVNPHDIVLHPLWARNDPLSADDPFDTPVVPAAPSAGDDLADRPAIQAAYRAAYPTGYAPLPCDLYTTHADEYRRRYLRLHAEVDGCIDRVRRAVTDHGSDDAVLVLTSDHGELLGAHGGLHQKWFTLYEEATRVPFIVVRTGRRATSARSVTTTPTSHVDVVPTLLTAAAIDAERVGDSLRAGFSEVHALPGRNLMPLVGGEGRTQLGDRAVYIQTRDHVLSGDTGASAPARALGLGGDPPTEMRIDVPGDVATNVEGIVVTSGEHVWKLVRTFDDPASWSEPGIAHRWSTSTGRHERTAVLADEWELYDLADDPDERRNRWADVPNSSREELAERLAHERTRCVPARNMAWTYATGAMPASWSP